MILGYEGGFVQKRIKLISSGTVKTRKKQAEEAALAKTANLDVDEYKPFFSKINFCYRHSHI